MVPPETRETVDTNKAIISLGFLEYVQITPDLYDFPSIKKNEAKALSTYTMNGKMSIPDLMAECPLNWYNRGYGNKSRTEARTVKTS